MEFREQELSVNEAKEIDMIDHLSSLGYKPSKIRNNDYRYHSPLRNEKTFSFKVNRKLNRWYDHGLSKGGNLIDFGIEYYRCTVGELLDKLHGNFSFQKPPVYHSELSIDPEHRVKVLGDFTLTPYPLLHYLEQSRIQVETAEKYYREVHYGLNGKTYYGIGFKNDLDGWEIRNPYFKAGSSPKRISTIDNRTDEVIVFEGFMDFLSFKVIHKSEPENHMDFVVLNSVSFFGEARPFMERHEAIRLYLDRDTTGQNYSRYALSLSGKYRDESGLYRHYKDVNDWLMNSGTRPKKHLRQKFP
jgi:DNA primase